MITVANVGTACGATLGAQADIWQTNAAGKYSDEASEGTSGQKWLRGFQTTDSNGRVQFATIYPRWYNGRTIHIHMKVRFTANGQNYVFNTQFFFTTR